MRKVVWDMEPGIDDALALILALHSPEVQLLGITAVAGNAPVDMTAVNARRVLPYLDAGSIPVVMGGARPLKRPLEDVLNYQGADGLGNCGLPAPLVAVFPEQACPARLFLNNFYELASAPEAADDLNTALRETEMPC